MILVETIRTYRNDNVETIRTYRNDNGDWAIIRVCGQTVTTEFGPVQPGDSWPTGAVALSSDRRRPTRATEVLPDADIDAVVAEHLEFARTWVWGVNDCMRPR